MVSDPRVTWRDPRVLLVLFLVFACGSLFGALVMRYVTEPVAPSPAIYWTKGGKTRTLQQFERELDLSPEQSRAIEEVLDDFMKYYHSLQSQMDDVRANGKVRVMNVLNPEQQRKFEEMLKDLPLREVH